MERQKTLPSSVFSNISSLEFLVKKSNRIGCVHAKSFQACPTLCHPMGCSLPGSSVHGILQTRILKWVAMPSSSRGSSWSRDWTHVSYVTYIGRQVLYHQWQLEMPYNVICQLYLNKDGQLRGGCGPCLEWKIFPMKNVASPLCNINVWLWIGKHGWPECGCVEFEFGQDFYSQIHWLYLG